MVVLEKRDLRNFCVYRLLFGLSYSLVTPVIPLFFESIGMSTLLIGMVISLGGVAETLTQIPFGIFSNAIGDKKSLKISMVLMAVILSLYIFTKDGFLAGSIYIIQGGILGMSVPATYSILSRSIDDNKRGECSGFAAAVFTFGGGVGALISGFIISRIKNFNIIFIMASIGVFLTFLFISLKIKRDKKFKYTEKKNEKLTFLFREISRKRLWSKIILLSLIAFLGDYIYSCILSLFHFYGKDVLNASVSYTSFIISIYLLVFGIGAPLAGKISDFIGNRKQFIISFMVMNISLLFLAQIRNLFLFTMVIIIYFMGATFLNTSLQSTLSEFGLEENIKGFVFGFVGAIESVGFSLGSIISAFIYSKSKSMLFIGLFVVSVIITILYLIIVNKTDM